MGGPVPQRAAERRSRRYSRSAVRAIQRLQRWLAMSGLADLVYWVSGWPVRTLVRILFSHWHRVDFVGRQNVPPRGQGFFLLSNHVSMAEAPVVAAELWPRPFWFPSKAEFYPNWFVGLFFLSITGTHAFPVRRGERDSDAIGLMEELLRRGDSVLLFPEGTRSRDGRLLPGKKGVGMIVHQARPQVLPVYVRGFEEIWPPHRLLPRVLRRGRALVVFGPVLDLSKYWERPLSSEVAQAIVDDVMAAIEALRERHGGESGQFT
jgi:1-acyl-sn-glycerol-3-phosphate acyltransferase